MVGKAGPRLGPVVFVQRWAHLPGWGSRRGVESRWEAGPGKGSARRGLTLVAIRTARSRRRQHGGRARTRESFSRGRAVRMRAVSVSLPQPLSTAWFRAAVRRPTPFCFASFAADGARVRAIAGQVCGFGAWIWAPPRAPPPRPGPAPPTSRRERYEPGAGGCQGRVTLGAPRHPTRATRCVVSRS